MKTSANLEFRAAQKSAVVCGDAISVKVRPTAESAVSEYEICIISMY